MAIDIYNIYNTTLQADQPFVDAILAQLRADIETNVANNVFYFVFDLVPFFVETETLQKNRIVDRILFEMRNAGISCKPVGVQIVVDQNEAPMLYTPGYNSINFDVTKLEINIRVRKNQEYLKAWC